MSNMRKIGQNQLGDALDYTKRATQLSINKVKIGIIREFNKDTQRARVEIAYKQVKEILEDGTKVWQEYPELVDLPVVTLFGGVDFLSMPIAVGDSCLVFFNDDEIDQWAQNGTGSPQTFRKHDISDGIVLVGIRPLTNTIVNYLGNGIRLSHGGGTSQIDLKDDLIETIAQLFHHTGDMQIDGNVTINGDVTVNGQLSTVVGGNTINYNTHTHSGVEVGSGNTGNPNAV